MNKMNLGKVYNDISTSKLIRLKSFFIICRFSFIIKNLNKIYSLSSKILGKNFTNNIIKHIYGDIFIGGENTKELEISLKELKREGLISISDFAREFLTKEEEVTEIDNIIKTYKDSIDVSINVDPLNSIAIKISSFGDVELIRELNTIQQILQEVEEMLIKNSNYKEIRNSLEKKKLENSFTEEHFEKLKKYFARVNKNGKINPFDLNIIEILKNPTQNEEILGVMKNALEFEQEEIDELKSFIDKIDERLSDVFNHAKSKNCLLMIDAEQSYLQTFIDNLAMFYFKQFNKGDECLLLTTLQCYLKRQPESLHRVFEYCRLNDLNVGLKLVRGAYMTEENEITKEDELESPINDKIENTHQHYNETIRYIFKNYKETDRVIDINIYKNIVLYCYS
jgi:proline dehydrogenase